MKIDRRQYFQVVSVASNVEDRCSVGHPVRRCEMTAPRVIRLATVSTVFLCLALGISFLSAVADRFGLWGVYGQPNVAWGNYARFLDYTAKLNWFLPAALIPAVAMVATAGEAVLGFLLVVGWNTRIVALLSGALLSTFALTMTAAVGVKAPLNFSVFSAAAGALLLAMHAHFPLSLDDVLRRNRRRNRERAGIIPHGPQGSRKSPDNTPRSTLLRGIRNRDWFWSLARSPSGLS